MTETITSLQNSRVKSAARLRDGRTRRREGKMIIDGARELSRAIDAGIQFEEVFLCLEICSNAAALDVISRLPETGAELLHLAPPVFEKIAFGNRSEGVVAVARTPATTLDDLELPPNPLIAVLEKVEKPGNLGAVLRSADGAGVSAVIVADPLTDIYNPNAIRASLGAVFTTPVVAAEVPEVLQWLRREKLNIFAARVDGSVEYDTANYREPTAIVLGSEAHGLSDAWNGDDIRAVRLPMCGRVDSLNVSNSAAIFFYEVLRQRRP